MDETKNKQMLIDDPIGRRILDAAIEIIRTEGFENLTIRRVAKESGCSNSAIYLRFEDKESLGRAVSALHAKPFLLTMDELYVKEEDFYSNMQRISTALMKKIYDMDQETVFMQMKFRGEKLTTENVFVKKLEVFIRNAVLKGEISITDPRNFAISLEASFWGLAYMCRLCDDISYEKACEILESQNRAFRSGMEIKNREDNFWEVLKINGVDVDKALERMKNNKDAYRSFLDEFFEDPDFQALEESLNSQNAREAFEYAHGLKGMAANLGLDRIYAEISVLVEILRQGSLTGAAESYQKVREACNVILELL